jgi:transposase
MRGDDLMEDGMWSYISPEKRVPKDHPLRPIRHMVDQALKSMWHEFADMYSKTGRPSIPPEKILRALLLQVFYSIRSERRLVEELDYNMLYRWFVGLSMDEPIWDHSTFSKNRDRLIQSDTATGFLRMINTQAQAAGLLSSDHFSVDGTLIEAWASQKSFKPKGTEPPSSPQGRNPEENFRGQKRKNETHASTTDPDARLFRKSEGTPAKLCYGGHVLMENRNGLVINTRVTLATGTAEREAAAEMIGEIPGNHRVTVGADKAYDCRDFVEDLRNMNVTPHVASKKKGTAVDSRTTQHDGYEISLRVRKRIEEVFGWEKTVGMLRKLRHRGREKVDWIFTFTAAAYNLVRMRNLGLGVSG